jgi:hypothetical protein
MYLLIFSVLYFKIMISIVHMSLKQQYNKIIVIFLVFRMLEMKSCRNVSIDWHVNSSGHLFMLQFRNY